MAETATFGAEVRRLRGRLGLTRVELAERVGCSVELVRKIERGERRPSRQVAELLAQWLELPLAEHDAFVCLARASSADDRAPLTATGAIPAAVTPLIGREVELQHLAGLLNDSACRLVTIVGLGGVGKTALALEAARRLDPALGSAHLVPLASLIDGSRVAETVADTLGIALVPGANAVAQLAERLRSRPVLLVLDNAEHLAASVATLLARLLAAVPLLQAIVTSRERLHIPGEWVVDLRGLSCPPEEEQNVGAHSDAVRLFLQRTQMLRPGFALGGEDLLTIARICHLLDGLPLGIELAVSWTRALPLQAIEGQIATGGAVSSAGARELPERHRSLHAVLSGSWELLSPFEQRSLRRLSVFCGSFTLEAARDVASVTPELLLALIDKSLLISSGDGQFSLHSVVRRYTEEQLSAVSDERGDTRRRHARNVATRFSHVDVNRPGRELNEHLIPLSSAFGDICAAWEWASEARDVQMIELMYRSLAAMLKLRGWIREGIELFGRAAAALETAGPAAVYLVARLRICQAECYQFLAMVAQARQLLVLSMETVRRAGDQREIARGLNCLKDVASTVGALREALRYAQEAAMCHEAAGDYASLAFRQSDLGVIAHDLGDLEAAQRFCRASYDTITRLGVDIDRHLIMCRLAYVEYACGRYDEAGMLLEEALARLDRRVAASHSYLACYLGLVRAAQGEVDDAVQLLREALAEVRAIHWPFGIGLALNFLGHVLVLRGAHSEAHALLAEGLSLCEAADNRTGTVFALTWLGAATTEASEAERHLLRALEIAAGMGANLLTLDALEALAALVLLCQFRGRVVACGPCQQKPASHMRRSVRCRHSRTSSLPTCPCSRDAKAGPHSSAISPAC